MADGRRGVGSKAHVRLCAAAGMCSLRDTLLTFRPLAPLCLCPQGASQVHARPRDAVGHCAGPLGHRRRGGHHGQAAGHPFRGWVRCTQGRGAFFLSRSEPCTGLQWPLARVQRTPLQLLRQALLLSSWSARRRPNLTLAPRSPTTPPAAEEAPSRLRAALAPLGAALEARLAPLRHSWSIGAVAGEAVREDAQNSEMVKRLRSSLFA